MVWRMVYQLVVHVGACELVLMWAGIQYFMTGAYRCKFGAPL
jgi:hypothetical protein